MGLLSCTRYCPSIISSHHSCGVIHNTAAIGTTIYYCCQRVLTCTSNSSPSCSNLTIQQFYSLASINNIIITPLLDRLWEVRTYLSQGIFRDPEDPFDSNFWRAGFLLSKFATRGTLAVVVVLRRRMEEGRNGFFAAAAVVVVAVPRALSRWSWCRGPAAAPCLGNVWLASRPHCLY